MKEDQRTKLTKRLLSEGLLTLLEKKDINDITVTELCQQSGINRSTFYRHYGQPKDILSDIKYQMCYRIKELAIKDNVKENPKKWITDVCQYFYQNVTVMKMLIKCRNDEQFIEIINEVSLTIINQLKMEHANLDEDNIKLITFYYAGGMYYILRQWLIEPIDKSYEEMAELISKLILKIN
ncbi:MAG: TetR/AcrR family transcriptional regulator C-terminal domain-containing protein [Erysipelotrichaceae bacterium]